MAGMRHDVMRVFDAADVCLQPSRTDAFPTTLIEAMAASVPVLATAVDGIPEIVTAGETGVLVPAPPRAQSFADALTDCWTILTSAAGLPARAATNTNGASRRGRGWPGRARCTTR